jgi:hypothetical protein
MYFKEAVVGDRVWDYVYGEGEVRQVDDILIHAVFLIKNIIEIDYHKNGKEYLSDSNQRLFYYADRPVVTLRGLPKTLRDSPSYQTEEEELNRLSKTPLYSDLAIKKTPEDEKTLEERVSILEEILYK